MVTNGKYSDCTYCTVVLYESRRPSDGQGCDQNARNILSCLERQYPQAGQLIEILCMRLHDCGTDVGFSRVVGSKCEFPITELAIEVAEISGRGVGCPEEIKAIVLNAVDSQPVTAGCIRHQLPESACTFGRKCISAPTAFDKDDCS